MYDISCKSPRTKAPTARKTASAIIIVASAKSWCLAVVTDTHENIARIGVKYKAIDMSIIMQHNSCSIKEPKSAIKIINAVFVQKPKSGGKPAAEANAIRIMQ